MRGMRDWRLLAAALGLAIASANPAAAWAHAMAHARAGEDQHHHIASLDAHDGPPEVSAPDLESEHGHARLDAAAAGTKPVPLVGLPVPATPVALDVAPSDRVGVARTASVGAPEPTGGDPPRLRSPPLR